MKRILRLKKKPIAAEESCISTQSIEREQRRGGPDHPGRARGARQLGADCEACDYLPRVITRGTTDRTAWRSPTRRQSEPSIRAAGRNCP
ncbi:hypothetical protein CEXT_48251 [Caerostris extrusa]|uniref:Uncharacterized protein n=1 Tax=Caerostris extrusa TaxID=172846 RepID=A0AAV4N0Z7_CAEEX|nr:hypothetical protein CEXT_48251 [Caerostris extrusa]